MASAAASRGIAVLWAKDRHRNLADSPQDDPPLGGDERQRIEQILEHLPRLVRTAEKVFQEHLGERLAEIDEYKRSPGPNVWIDRKDQASGKWGLWTFVVELKNSDYGWHIEFSGLQFKQIWGGD